MFRFLIASVIALAFVPQSPAQHDDSAKSRAKAALLLAQMKRATTCSDCESKASASLALAKRQRERDTCLGDVAEASAKAKAENKWLFVWVGMTCHDAPHVRAAFPGVIHCHADESAGDKTPRLLVGPLSDGAYKVFPRDAVESEKAAERIRKEVDGYQAAPPQASVSSVRTLNC